MKTLNIVFYLIVLGVNVCTLHLSCVSVHDGVGVVRRGEQLVPSPTRIANAFLSSLLLTKYLQIELFAGHWLAYVSCLYVHIDIS